MKDLTLSQQYALLALDGQESIHPSVAKSAVLRAVSAAQVLETELGKADVDSFSEFSSALQKAVQMAKAYAPFVRKIEIEVETLEQVKEAVEAGADIIMLDNMTPEVMKQAVELIDGRAQTECSGNITKENIQKIREIGVDFVSSGALTHSAPILDISMKNLHAV